MINLDEINKTILDLEQHDTTYTTCERLAWLYIVRDHMKGVQQEDEVSRETFTGTESGELERAMHGKPLHQIMPILEEHMKVVRLLHPKEYAAVIDKIKSL